MLSGYTQPLLVTSAGSRRSRVIFIVEQGGQVKRATRRDGRWKRLGTFLDISSLTHDTTIQVNRDRGLLGLAFHPQYKKNGLFYVNYTRRTDGPGDGDSVIAEYRRWNRAQADPSSRRVVMVITQPHPGHNAGHLAFGPDGMLYIGSGDGNGFGDQLKAGQDVDTLLGKILRIDPRDPDGRKGPRRYGVPKGNPYVGKPGRDEIWALGLRNPWRFSFDRRKGDLWIGDVGETQREEVNRARSDSSGRNAGRGRNFGWSDCEGSLEFAGGEAGPACQLHVLPTHDYAHAFPTWCAVMGGYVFRGPGAKAWRGLYIAGDFCGGVFVLDGSGRLRLADDTDRRITSFGEDAAGRLYAADRPRGLVYRVHLRGGRP
ncbi:PQQ-dependent sugar dehydrogenase [soil metagenome]